MRRTCRLPTQAALDGCDSLHTVPTQDLWNANMLLHRMPRLLVHGCHKGGAMPWLHKTDALPGLVLNSLTCSIKLETVSVHASHIG